MSAPFILLDDARADGASPARLYENPREIVVARTVDGVLPALEQIAALRGGGLHLAGYLAYEAGLAFEPKLANLAPARCGAMGPLVWFGAFESYRELVADEVPAWLAEQAAG